MTGASTYTPVLASVFSSVTCVEVDRRLVEAARINVVANGIQAKVNLIHAPVEKCKRILAEAKHGGEDAVWVDSCSVSATLFILILS